MSEFSVFQSTDALPSGFVQLDASDCILKWNRWLEDRTGMQRADLIGRNIQDVYPQASKLHQTIQEVRATGQSLLRSQLIHQFILPIPLPKGHFSGFEWMQQECHVVPVGEGMVISVRDVTSLVVGRNRLLKLQDEWKRTKNAAIRGAQQKTEFLNVMSHEIRTPLNAIHLFCSVLLSDEPQRMSEDQLSQIEGIRRAAEDLTAQVNDLLDMGKIEAGKMTIRNDEFTVLALFDSLGSLLQPLANKPGVELIFEPTNIEDVIRTDENKLSHILRNLITNALKFTTRGTVRVSARKTAEAIIWQVSDTGMGIPEESLNRIFDDFYQVESDVQRRVYGSGLGLSISRKLTVMLGGILEATSTLGKGSVFSVTIPLERLGMK